MPKPRDFIVEFDTQKMYLMQTVAQRCLEMRAPAAYAGVRSPFFHMVMEPNEQTSAAFIRACGSDKITPLFKENEPRKVMLSTPCCCIGFQRNKLFWTVSAKDIEKTEDVIALLRTVHEGDKNVAVRLRPKKAPKDADVEQQSIRDAIKFFERAA
jgi:hypothetical protein